MLQLSLFFFSIFSFLLLFWRERFEERQKKKISTLHFGVAWFGADLYGTTTTGLRGREGHEVHDDWTEQVPCCLHLKKKEHLIDTLYYITAQGLMV